ncbi:MAG: FadR family transcriptional regulator [Deltaproteobacteria bacterium]|nr:FadR family transcriptional regulator [Deltaproteobacteria bacterium]
MTRFKSLKKPPLSEEVEKQLRASINAGIYRPGDKLPSERELVDQFEVSRVTVRDALKRLQNLGLISTRRGLKAGAYVLEPSPQPFTLGIDNLIQMKMVNFAHLIEIRLYIEPDVARSAALSATGKDVKRLTALLDDAERYAASHPKQARMTNVRFHCEVAKTVQNALIVILCESITQVYSAMLIELTHTKLDEKGIRKLISEHRNILEAIALKKPREAYERTKTHLLETYNTYSRIMPGPTDPRVGKRIRYLATL